MTIETLKRYAADCLRDAIEDVRRDGTLTAMFTLFLRGGGAEMIATDGSTTNSRTGKDAVARIIRGRIATGEVEATVFRSDTFYSDDLTPETNRIRLALQLNIEQAGAAGLCTVKEAVTVILESPIYHQFMRQEYRRHEGRAELVGDPYISDDAIPGEGTVMRDSRFSNFFRTPPAGAQARPS